MTRPNQRLPDDAQSSEPVTDSPGVADVLCGPGCECDDDGAPVRSVQPALSVRGLSVGYDGVAALRGVDFDVAPGRITALIGPSGCGKTSLLSSINRLTDLIPGCRVDGSIRLGDQEVLARATDVLALRRRVGMIFQKPNPFPLSIRRNLDLPLREHGVRGRARRDDIAEAALRDVGLWDEVEGRLDAPAQALSGGQKQRLCIARALALQPEIVLFDEPCSSLDPISSGVVEDLIVGLRGRYTVVIVTHNLAQARRIADRVAFFWLRDGAGTLVEQGPARQLFETPRHALTRAYVDGMRG